MRRGSEAAKTDERRRMGPLHRQSVAEISQEMGIHVITLYKWRKAWRLHEEVVPASQKDPEGWGLAEKFTVMLVCDRCVWVLLQAGSVPRTGRSLAPSRPGWQWRAAADDGRSERLPEAPREGSAGDQAAQAVAAPQGKCTGGGGCTANRLK
jgi:hypothetical protein